MPLVKHYRIFCLDENDWRSTWAETLITTCPVDSEHAVNPESVQLIKENLINFGVDSTANTNSTSTLIATQASDSNVFIPGGNYTLIGNNLAQALTNKTIIDNTNTVEASQLRSGIVLSGGPVGVGEALVSTGPSGASWFGHDSLVGSGSNTHAQIDTHLGSTGNPHNVSKSQVGLGNVENIKVNLTGIAIPGSTDDSSVGYSVGSRWWFNGVEYVCLDASIGSAIWKETTINGSNVGGSGIGVFKEKNGEILEFRNVGAGSNRIAIVDNSDTIEIDVVESNLVISNMSGTLGVPNGGTGKGTLASGKVLVGSDTGAISDVKNAPVGDFVGTTDVQNLTNKILDSSTNTLSCDQLKTTGANVVISSASPPVSGQILTATGATSANWQGIGNQIVSGTVMDSTTSDIYAVIDSMTSTPVAGTYLVLFSSSARITLPDESGIYGIHVDGTLIPHSERLVFNATGLSLDILSLSIGTQCIASVNGSQAIDVRFRTTGSTFKIYERSMILIRLS